MRLPAAFCLLLTATACATAAPAPPSPPTGTPIVVRVIESREMAYVASRSSNDATFAQGFAYRLAPRDGGGTSFIALAAAADCPAAGDTGRLYEMSFVRRQIAFGITNAVDREWTTDLEIVSCRAIAGE